MHNLVYKVFKTIAMAMIFVFVWDIVFYMYRTASLDQRMKSLMSSMQKVVMENDCLPEDSATMYKSLIGNIVLDFNHVAYTDAANNAQDLGEFIAAVGWNFRTDAQNIGVTSISGLRSDYNYWSGTFSSPVYTNILHKKMGEPGGYGDITVVQVRVLVNQPFWGFSGGYGGQNWGRLTPARNKTVMDYTYYVPCLKYKSVTQ